MCKNAAGFTMHIRVCKKHREIDWKLVQMQRKHEDASLNHHGRSQSPRAQKRRRVEVFEDRESNDADNTGHHNYDPGAEFVEGCSTTRTRMELRSELSEPEIATVPVRIINTLCMLYSIT